MNDSSGEYDAYATGLWRLVSPGHQPFSKTGKRIHNYLLGQKEIFQGLWRDNLIRFATGQYYPHCEFCKCKKPKLLPRSSFTTEDIASLRVLKLNRPAHSEMELVEDFNVGYKSANFMSKKSKQGRPPR